MTDQSQQQADDEQAFVRCVELVRIARSGERFSDKDIQDLIYFLRLGSYFKERA